MGSDGMIMCFERTEKRQQGTAVLEDHDDLMQYFSREGKVSGRTTWAPCIISL